MTSAVLNCAVLCKRAERTCMLAAAHMHTAAARMRLALKFDVTRVDGHVQ
jgi:hypothetical protein